MTKNVDLFDSTYGNFDERVLAEIRRETFGEDIGQNSWTTVDEYDRFSEWLGLTGDAHVLEVASGSGGPAMHLARKYGCRITGIDVSDEGVAVANLAAARSGVDNAAFRTADVDDRLPFEDETFDAVVCIDSMNHFRDRPAVFREWHRVLRPGGRALFTDPIVITGPVSNEEIAARSSIGFFLFVPLEVTRRYLDEARFALLRCEDATENVARTSGRWHDARLRRRGDLIGIEGAERYEGLQTFFAAVHRLTRERRLSRFVLLAEKAESKR